MNLISKSTYMEVTEKRKFPRFPVANSVLCFRYGREMTMQTLNVSLGGLKLEANFGLGVGESLDLAILTNGTRIHCRGTILAIEDFKHKVYARLRFDRIPDSEYRKLYDYLHALYWGRYEKWVVGGIFILSAYLAYLLIFRG